MAITIGTSTITVNSGAVMPLIFVKKTEDYIKTLVQYINFYKNKKICLFPQVAQYHLAKSIPSCLDPPPQQLT